MKYMRTTTDLSFDYLEDLVIYTYVHHSDHVDYARVQKLVGEIYPEYTKQSYSILLNAGTAID